MNPTENLKPGMTGTESIEVKDELTVGHFIDGMPMVYATPMMIFLMETAAANAVHPHLADGWVSVGAAVNIKHLAATPVGRIVTAAAEVLEIDGRSVTLKITAHDGEQTIGEGTHVRGVINLQKFKARLAEKA